MVSSDDIASLIILDFRSLMSFASVEETTHCSAFVLLDSKVHKIHFSTGDNNALYIVTLLRDLKARSWKHSLLWVKEKLRESYLVTCPQEDIDESLLIQCSFLGHSSRMFLIYFPRGFLIFKTIVALSFSTFHFVSFS